MVKRILFAILLVAALAVSALFTWMNPGEVALDLGLTEVSTPLGLAFVAAIAVGWLIGILSAALWIARVSADRRRLRAQLKDASAGGLAVRDERG